MAESSQAVAVAAISSTGDIQRSPRQQASVACQTDSLELDEATLRNELAMNAYLDILSVLDDDKQPVYHDLGADYANKLFLHQAMADDPEEDEEDEEDKEDEEELADQKTPTAALPEPPDEGQQRGGRLQSLESQVIEAEWSLRCKLAQVRELAKHPVQRWLEGALLHTDGGSGSYGSGSPFDSRAQSVRSHQLRYQQQQQQLRQRHHSSGQATLSHCSRPSSVAALSEVFVSDSDESEDDNQEEDGEESERNKTKAEMTFYNCAVHGVEVPESFVRIKLRGVEEDWQQQHQSDKATP